MCCEMQSECSSRATLAPKKGGGVVGAPLNSRLRAGAGVGQARDWLSTVKMHRGPREALGAGSSSSESGSDSDRFRLRRTRRLAQRRAAWLLRLK